MDFLSVCRYILQTLLTLINRLSCVSPIQRNWIFILSDGILDQKGTFYQVKCAHHDGEILRYTTDYILIRFSVIQKFTVRLRDLARTRSQKFFIITQLSNRRRKVPVFQYSIQTFFFKETLRRQSIRFKDFFVISNLKCIYAYIKKIGSKPRIFASDITTY